MFKISWARESDPYRVTFILVPDVRALFDAYFVITRYGRKDGCKPINVTVTNLDGDVIDMTKGLNHAASFGTYSASE